MNTTNEVTISQIINDLTNGYTRTKTSKGYTGNGKSLEEKYSLTKKQLTVLFSNPSLKGRKTKKIIPFPFKLVDDVTNIIEDFSKISTASTKEEFDLTPQY